MKEAKNLFEKQHGRLYCEVCDFDFGTQYGKSGENYIEAHHIVPLSQITGIHEIKPTDFRMLCSNCHSIIHRRFVEGEELDVERLKKIIKIKFEV